MLPRGPGSPYDVPALALHEAVFGGRLRGQRPAVVEATSGRAVTYAELTAAVGSIAAGLTGAGLGQGTVIGVQLPDSPEFALAAYGVLAAGATLVPVRPLLPVRETARQLAETGARALITWPVLLDLALAAAKETAVERIFCVGEEPEAEPFARLLAGGPAPRVPIEPARDVAVIAWTRGSTGPPRGIRLTHRNLVAGLVQFAGAGVLSTADVVLSGIPFADAIGLNGVLGPALHLGATVVSRPAAGRHDLLHTLQDHRVTVAVLPPALVKVLAYDRTVARYNLRSLRSVVSAGGPLPPEVARACSGRLRCPVRQAYGLAEAAGFTHLNLRAAEEGTLDSVGRGLPAVSSRIVDPATGADQPAYQPGELTLRGAMVAGEPGRWLATGDAAFADEHGRVYIMGRMGDGHAEPPCDPETVLGTHPAVREAVVVPAPDPELGLAPHAFVVLREPVPEADLLAYVNAHVPAYQQVLAVHPVPEIPRTPAGRVLRRTLLQRVRPA